MTSAQRQDGGNCSHCGGFHMLSASHCSLTCVFTPSSSVSYSFLGDKISCSNGLRPRRIWVLKVTQHCVGLYFCFPFVIDQTKRAPQHVCQLKLFLLSDIREGGTDRVGEDKLIENRHEGKWCLASSDFWLAPRVFFSPFSSFPDSLRLCNRNWFILLNHVTEITSGSPYIEHNIHCRDGVIRDQIQVITVKSNE